MSGHADWRDIAFARLTNETFDLLVIGGGITGAGIARDAALRGLRVALCERDDFASGTSSRSSRLVHGGIRYLEHGHLHLVFEASRERRTLLRIAPHLVHPLPFTWPAYRGSRIPRWKQWAGLALYDALALYRNQAHHRLSRAALLAVEPGLREDGLTGGARYWDAATNDARLTLANALGAARAGAVVLNHAAVTALVAHDGEVRGAEVEDQLSARRTRVSASCVVNAAGPWGDTVRALEGGAAAPSVRGSAGAHIAVPHERVGNRDAINVLSPRDGRVMFVLPAGACTIVGTTETPARSTPDEVRATREDVRYLLDSCNAYFPRAQLADHDVIAAWSGIRPLAASLARGDAGSASREHTIARGASGVLTVSGGKLTTYRAMAEQVVDRVVETLGRRRFAACTSDELPLPGGDFASLDALGRAAAEWTLDESAARRLVRTYGSGWRTVWELLAADPRLAEPIDAGLPYTVGDALFALGAEMACTLADILIRRMPLAFETRDAGVAAADRLSRALAPRLGWDGTRVASEMRRYEAEAKRMFAIDLV